METLHIHEVAEGQEKAEETIIQALGFDMLAAQISGRELRGSEQLNEGSLADKGRRSSTLKSEKRESTFTTQENATRAEDNAAQQRLHPAPQQQQTATSLRQQFNLGSAPVSGLALGTSATSAIDGLKRSADTMVLQEHNATLKAKDLVQKLDAATKSKNLLEEQMVQSQQKMREMEVKSQEDAKQFQDTMARLEVVFSTHASLELEMRHVKEHLDAGAENEADLNNRWTNQDLEVKDLLDRFEKLQQELAEAQSKLANAEEDLRLSSSECSTAKAECLRLQEETQKIQAENMQLVDKQQKLRDVEAQLSSVSTSASAREAALKANHDASQQQLQSLTRLLAESRAKESKQAEELRVAESSVVRLKQELQGELEAATAATQTWNQKLAVAQSKADQKLHSLEKAHEQEVQELRSQLRAVEQQGASSSAALEKELAEAKGEVLQHAKACAAAEAKHREVELLCKKQAEDLAKAQSLLQSAEEQHSSAQAASKHLQGIESRYQAALDKIKALEGEHAVQCSAVKAAEEALSASRQQQQVMASSQDALQQSLNTLAAKVAQLELEVKASKAAAAEAAAALEAERARQQTGAVDLEAMAEKMTSAEQEVLSAKSAARAASAAEQAAKMEAQAAKAQAEAAKAQAEAAKAQAEAVKAQAEAAKEEAAAAKDEAEAAKEEAAKAQAQAAKSEAAEAAKAEAAKAEAAKAQAEVAKAQAESAKAQAEATKAQAEAARAQAELAIAEAQAATQAAKMKAEAAQAPGLPHPASSLEAEAAKAEAAAQAAKEAQAQAEASSAQAAIVQALEPEPAKPAPASTAELNAAAAAKTFKDSGFSKQQLPLSQGAGDVVEATQRGSQQYARAAPTKTQPQPAADPRAGLFGQEAAEDKQAVPRGRKAAPAPAAPPAAPAAASQQWDWLESEDHDGEIRGLSQVLVLSQPEQQEASMPGKRSRRHRSDAAKLPAATAPLSQPHPMDAAPAAAAAAVSSKVNSRQVTEAGKQTSRANKAEGKERAPAAGGSTRLASSQAAAKGKPLPATSARPSASRQRAQDVDDRPGPEHDASQVQQQREGGGSQKSYLEDSLMGFDRLLEPRVQPSPQVMSKRREAADKRPQQSQAAAQPSRAAKRPRQGLDWLDEEPVQGSQDVKEKSKVRPTASNVSARPAMSGNPTQAHNQGKSASRLKMMLSQADQPNVRDMPPPPSRPQNDSSRAKAGSSKKTAPKVSPPGGTQEDLQVRFGKSRSTHATPAKSSQPITDDFFDLFSMT